MSSELLIGDENNLVEIGDLPFDLATPDAMAVSDQGLIAIGASEPPADGGEIIRVSGDGVNWQTPEGAKHHGLASQITSIRWLRPCAIDFGLPTGGIQIPTNTGEVIELPPGAPGTVLLPGEPDMAPTWGRLNLDDLGDVDTTTTPPVEGDGLVYDATLGLWVPTQVAASVDWADVENKPAAFPPEAHTHPFSDLSDIGGQPVNENVLTFTPSGPEWQPPQDAAWSEITGKPATFPPETHNHLLSNLADVYAGTVAPGQVLAWSDDNPYGWKVVNPPTGGVSDHGALTGLGNDDHTQYYNQARGDARYAPLSAEAKAKWADARSKAVISGGGNISLGNLGNGYYRISWTKRFIWIPFDRDLATNGYFETPGTGSADIPNWSGLYYVPPLAGGGQNSGTMQVYAYNDPAHNIPDSALLICRREGDWDSALIFANGFSLQAGQLQGSLSRPFSALNADWATSANTATSATVATTATYCSTSWERLGRVALGAVGQLSFSVPTSGYRNLMIVGQARSTRTSLKSDALCIRFNNTANAGYHNNYANFHANGVYSGGWGTGKTYIPISLLETDIGWGGGLSPVTFFITSYRVGYAKRIHALPGHNIGDLTQVDSYLQCRAGVWFDGTAISSIQFFAEQGINNNLAAGSEFTIYGSRE